MSSAPQVSAVLLCYNCEAFVAEAVESALSQDCEPIEIVISDDASDDGTFGIVERAVSSYPGPHRVSLRRRGSNSGSKSAHLNDAFQSASGQILVSFDGDDVSEARRVRRIVDAFRESPDAHAVYSTFSLIDAEGRPLGAGKVPHPAEGEDAATWFARVDAFAAGTTLAVRREVVERFPPLDPSIHEDITLPFRASLLGGVRFIDEPLVRARRHGGSLTAELERFESIERYRARMLRGIETARRNLASRIDDLETIRREAPQRGADWAQLLEVASASMDGAERTAGLVDPSLQVRIRTLIRLLSSGAYRDELAQNVCLALLPGTYLRYKRRTLRGG